MTETHEPRAFRTAIGFVPVDCADPDRLRAWWVRSWVFAPRAATRRRPSAASLPAPGEVGLCFLRVPELKIAKNRVHLDITVSDLEAATVWVEAHGGWRRGDDADREEHGWRWRRMADPNGNEFCLVPEGSG
jgi:hypothetical protein